MIAADLLPRSSLPACMGGFCVRRNACERHLTPDRAHVVERLCGRGEEMPAPVRIVRGNDLTAGRSAEGVAA